MDRRISKIFSKSIKLTLCLAIALFTVCLPNFNGGVAFAAKKKKKESKSEVVKPSSKKTSKKKSKKAPIDKGSNDESGADTSDATTVEGTTATKHKRFEVLLNLGLAPNPMLGFGSTVGYFLNPSTAIEGSFLMASGKSDVVALSSTVVGTRLRKSFGTIPYVAGGLAMRMISGKWNTLSEDESEEFVSGASSNAIALDLAVGGQFMLGSILLGADVAGIMYPVVKLSNTEQLPEGTYSGSDYTAQKEKFDKFTGMNLILFRVVVGLAF